MKQIHQVLARKYRPRDFTQLAGQDHVTRPLINALTNHRLHHAYLFTGTRGVGKTTIARILAKCFNCETGVTAKPCGECDACVSIDRGNYADLIEVDAASRTKVEDTRDLLDNVQYLPTKARYKIYIIDEVHALSGHSFNALLKTLEEPPEHVKFLLATTDPKKLPITVLSRCLQFHLKNMSPAMIAEYLQRIVQEEKITSEPEALYKIARAANGSMRDALSILDQAIAFGSMDEKFCIATNDVNHMLGDIEQVHLDNILRALIANDGKQLLQVVAHLAEHAADFTNVLNELIARLHRIAVLQIIPDSPVETRYSVSHTAPVETCYSASHTAYNASQTYSSEETASLEFSQQISKADVHLYHQIALLGRRDLPLFPDARMGLEMTLLRMLAFRPVTTVEAPYRASQALPPNAVNTHSVEAAPSVQNKTTETSHNKAVEMPVAQSKTVETPYSASLQSEIIERDHQSPPNLTNIIWSELLPKLHLSGMVHALATNCILKNNSHNSLELILDPVHSALLNKNLQARLNDALNQHFNGALKLSINIGKLTTSTPAMQQEKLMNDKQLAATKKIENDTTVKKIIDTFGATIDKIMIND